MENRINWREAMDLAKTGKQIPENRIDYEDEIIEYDEDCLPLSKEDILTGKIVKTENIIILTDDNYNWLEQLTKNQPVSVKVNLILDYFRQLNVQLQTT